MNWIKSDIAPFPRNFPQIVIDKSEDWFSAWLANLFVRRGEVNC
jgi:hypothetical protein